MLKFIGKNIITGLITILPVVLTVYLLYWFAVTAEAVLGGTIRAVLPEGLYWPGMGLTIGLVSAFIIGLLMHAYLVQRLFAMAEQLLYHTPIIKSIYRAFRDFMDYFSPNRKKEFEQVVAIKIGDTDMEVIGFVTRTDMETMPEDFGGEDRVLVYVPLSYMIGGYAVLMPRSAVRPLAMNMQEAMRFTLTARITGSGEGRSK